MSRRHEQEWRDSVQDSRLPPAQLRATQVGRYVYKPEPKTSLVWRVSLLAGAAAMAYLGWTVFRDPTVGDGKALGYGMLCFAGAVVTAGAAIARD